MEETEEQQCAQVTACAFTGHRPTRFSFKYDEEHPDCLKLKAVLAEQIGFLYQQGVTDFYTGCALGVDMWAGEAVLSLMELHPEVKLHCIVPFAGQERKWTDEQQARYHAMLRRSSETIIVQEKYDKECYFNRNRYLVDHAGVLLAVYDMQANKRSGTGYTVHYVQAQGKPVIAIDPDNFCVNFLGEESEKIFSKNLKNFATYGDKTVLIERKAFENQTRR